MTVVVFGMFTTGVLRHSHGRLVWSIHLVVNVQPTVIQLNIITSNKFGLHLKVTSLQLVDSITALVCERHTVRYNKMIACTFSVSMSSKSSAGCES